MNPLSLMLMGGGLNILGNLFGRNRQAQQINPLSDAGYQNILDEIATYQAAQDKALSQANIAQSRINQAANQAENIQSQMRNVSVPGANDWFDTYVSEQVPGYEQIATRVASKATRGGAEGAAERAQAASRQAARNVASQFAGSGGMYSGASQNAIAQGAATPLENYLNQAAQNYQSAFMNSFSPLAQQGQNLAYRGEQDAFQNAMNQLSSMLQGSQVYGNLASSAGQNALGQASQAGQNLNQVRQFRQDFEQPVYSYGQQQPSALSNIGSGLSNLAALWGAFGNNPMGASNSNLGGLFNRSTMPYGEYSMNMNTNPWGVWGP